MMFAKGILDKALSQRAERAARERAWAKASTHRDTPRPPIRRVPSLECWRVLGVTPAATRDQVIAAYKAKAKIMHPDVGGSEEAMTRLNRARDEALEHAD